MPSSASSSRTPSEHTSPLVWLASLGLSVLYFLTHLSALTALPIFADEAIYLHWSQLIITDWHQYAFFALNDGKTPLQIWLNIPFLLSFSDPLFAGRLLAVVAGFFQLGATGYITHLLGGRPKTVLLAALFTTVLPFWYFHHRMALLDGLLVLWLSLTIAATIKLAQSFHEIKRSPTLVELLLPQVWLQVLFQHRRWFWFGLAGTFFGLALLTKVPAILIAPAIGLSFVLPGKISFTQRLQLLGLLAGVGVFGLAIFFSLKLHPAFSQLFTRGSDFLYPWQEVVLDGKWRQTIVNFPTYSSYFISYLTWPIVGLSLAGLFSPYRKKAHHYLFWSGLGFAGPIMLLGIVVYPRYLFPSTLFLTVGAALSTQDLIDRFVTAQNHMGAKVIAGFTIVSLLGHALGSSSMFMTTAITSPNSSSFVPADKVQYLHEWSSGHGIVETVRLLQSLAQTETVAVGTEGYFGTLPDALLVYLFNQDVSHLYVEGIGYPIKTIPENFAGRAKEFNRTVIVVNSHRLELRDPEMKLLASYCRPNNAPCLQVWDITQLIQNGTHLEPK